MPAPEVPPPPATITIVDAFSIELNGLVTKVDNLIRKTVLKMMAQGLREGADPSNK